MKGFVNSFQSMGAVDGPGLRFVVFTQGCPLHCPYCHNPETQSAGGTAYTAEEIVQKVLRYRPYFGEEGGVTVSGGEPLLQPEFVTELFSMLHKEGIHTALDTSGAGNLEQAAEVLQYTDLVLCDLKFSSEDAYRTHCGGSLAQTLRFMELTEQKKIPMWIRHVVAPGLTDTPESIRAIQHLGQRFSNVVKFEWLPFKNICKVKYDKLQVTFPMGDSPSYSQAQVDALVASAIELC